MDSRREWIVGGSGWQERDDSRMDRIAGRREWILGGNQINMFKDEGMDE